MMIKRKKNIIAKLTTEKIPDIFGQTYSDIEEYAGGQQLDDPRMTWPGFFKVACKWWCLGIAISMIAFLLHI